MTELEQIRAALAAASTATGPLRTVYTACARAQLDRLRAELDQTEGHVRALEVEIGRVSRDVTQLSLAEREGSQ